jgi:hypothetical protein
VLDLQEMIFRINKCSRMESTPVNATWYLEQAITSRIIVIIIKNHATNHNPKHACSSAPAPQYENAVVDFILGGDISLHAAGGQQFQQLVGAVSNGNTPPSTHTIL